MIIAQSVHMVFILAAVRWMDENGNGHLTLGSGRCFWKKTVSRENVNPRWETLYGGYLRGGMMKFSEWWNEYIEDKDCPLLKVNWSFEEIGFIYDSMKMAYEHKEVEWKPKKFIAS